MPQFGDKFFALARDIALSRSIRSASMAGRTWKSRIDSKRGN
ncbi:hypothetical protein BUH_5894 [Burkholderia pseudomallei Pakistan 9]|nr:hypothetical protein BUH_5894 [Burkholderia pseudomallei Pakistan 9]